MGKKHYVSYNQVHQNVQNSVKYIKEYNPEVIVAIGGGKFLKDFNF